MSFITPSSGRWRIKFSSDGARIDKYFGVSTNYPVPFDYNWEGETDIVIFRPSSGKWSLIRSGDIPLPRN